MQANKVLLQRKYSRVIEIFASEAKISFEEALDKFYTSVTYDLMSNGISDLHCFSDKYLAEELLYEFNYRDKKEFIY